MLDIELTFTGDIANDGLIDFYDGARAIAGFQRSLALTTHLVINGEIITQAPALYGARILLPAFEEGSWRTRAKIAFGAAIALGSVGKDSPVGQIVTSVYDYVLKETMGFGVDYEKTLQQQYAEHFRDHGISEEKLDSLAEKIEPSVADMHRPIVISETASSAQIGAPFQRIGPELSPLTYEYVRQTVFSPEAEELEGYISSYNINTYKGRIFCADESRPIPFELAQDARNTVTVGVLTRSQHFNGQKRFDDRARVKITAHRLTSNTGRLKRLHVLRAEALG